MFSRLFDCKAIAAELGMHSIPRVQYSDNRLPIPAGIQLPRVENTRILIFPSRIGLIAMRKSTGKALADLRSGSFACWLGIVLVQTASAADSGVDLPDNFTPFESEQLLSEAGAAFADRDFRAAERAASEALQILKVNHGLLSEHQFPALQKQSEALRAQQKWDVLDQHFAYFEWLLSRMVTKDFDAYLSGTEILNSLYLATAADIHNLQHAHYLIAAKQLNWRAVSAIEQREGPESLRLAPWLYKIVLSHYYQSALIKRRGMTSYEYKSETPDIVNGWSLSKNESIEKSYNIGLELLLRIRSLYGNSTLASATTDAQMLMHLADWELLFERDDAALDYYQLAFARLQATNPGDDVLQRWFAAPVIIPATRLLESPGQQLQLALDFVAWSPVFPGVRQPPALGPAPLLVSAEYVASARFNLEATPITSTDGGRLHYVVQDLALESVLPDNARVANLAHRQIASLQFRPVLVEGEVAPATGIELNYRFAPEPAPTLPVTAR